MCVCLCVQACVHVCVRVYVRMCASGDVTQGTIGGVQVSTWPGYADWEVHRLAAPSCPMHSMDMTYMGGHTELSMAMWAS